jgi:hypothetical protein
MLLHDPTQGFIPARSDEPDGFPRPVFILDQFEEIFTLGERPARRAFSAAFRETLAVLVEDHTPEAVRALLQTNDDLAERLDYKVQRTRVLLSLREDFLYLLERWQRAIPSLMENRVELLMLNGPKAFEAVVRPGQLRPGMPAIMPDDVGCAVVRFVAGAAADAPLEQIDAVPPLLSLVCAELNAQRLLSGAQQIPASSMPCSRRKISSLTAMATDVRRTACATRISAFACLKGPTFINWQRTAAPASR